jgi:hypothetical protein
VEHVHAPSMDVCATPSGHAKQAVRSSFGLSDPAHGWQIPMVE